MIAAINLGITAAGWALLPYADVQPLEQVTWQDPQLSADNQPVKDDKGQPLMVDKSSATQRIAMGRVASQLAIKMLGTNGGGFFNANSAHPFKNPTPFANLLQMLNIFLIPAALCFVFGRMAGDMRQGWAVFAAMALLFVVFAAASMSFEQQDNPKLAALGVDQLASATQSGGNMEGKEVRFGSNASALFATVTTAASCGAVNAMHDAFTPLSGVVPLVPMQLGEVVFGMTAAEVDALVRRHRKGAWFGFIGEPRVDVLTLNLALNGEPNGAPNGPPKQSPR